MESEQKSQWALFIIDTMHKLIHKVQGVWHERDEAMEYASNFGVPVGWCAMVAEFRPVAIYANPDEGFNHEHMKRQYDPVHFPELDAMPWDKKPTLVPKGQQN